MSTLTNAPSSAVDTGILLDAGTNEAEILVFLIHGRRFGVNVAKVREVIPIEDVTDIPRSHPAVDGLVDVREAVVPLLNLAKYLYDCDDDPTENDSLMLLEFNNEKIAFRVQGIERIYRVSWKDTLPAPPLGKEVAPVTSVVRQEAGLVPLLDFESICAVTGVGGGNVRLETIPKVELVDRTTLPIVFADDSRLICEMVKDTLAEAGYTNLKGFADGQELWEYIDTLAEGCTPEEFQHKIACVVTDIEMPRMDGLTFTKKLRSHPVMGDTPVVVFSSIASKDNEKKGRQVGATAQVAKPHYDELVTSIGKIFDKTMAMAK